MDVLLLVFNNCWTDSGLETFKGEIKTVNGLILFQREFVTTRQTLNFQLHDEVYFFRFLMYAIEKGRVTGNGGTMVKV